MKTLRFTSLIVMLSMLFILSSCVFSRTLLLSESANTDKSAAKEYVAQVFQAIKTKDKELLKNVFSPNARTDAEELDENIDKLMELFGGESLSYSNDLLVSSSESIDYGDKVIIIDFTLKIDYDGDDEYCMYFHGCRQDDYDSNNEGLTSLSVYLLRDEYAYGYNTEHQNPGIEFFYRDGENIK